MPTGTVKWFNENDEGYKTLKEGQKVAYELKLGKNGKYQASEVVKSQ